MTSPPAGAAGSPPEQQSDPFAPSEPDGLRADHAAVEGLFHSEWGRLIGAARLLLDEPSDAEEVVQDAFVQLLRHWHQVRDLQRAPTWLRTTVVNLSRARLRRRLVARRHPPQAYLDVEAADGSASASDDVARVAAALATLPRRQRECVVLRHWSELDQSEIASTLGISVGSVKTHLHRAMSALGDCLEDERDGT